MSDRPHATVDEMEERWGVLHVLEKWLQTPMMVLSFAWLVFEIVELWTSMRGRRGAHPHRVACLAGKVLVRHPCPPCLL